VFDSNLKPAVGVQATAISAFDGGVVPDVPFLYDRASAGDCELIVKSIDAQGHPRGWWRAGNSFRSDHVGEPELTLAKLRALSSATTPQTFTCVPPGSGYRMGIDRDEDGVYDYDEILRGTDPTVPDGAQPFPAAKLQIRNHLPDDEAKNAASVQIKSATLPIPPVGSASDPRCNGDPDGTVKATLTLASTTSGADYTTPLPCEHWTLVGSADDPIGYKYADKSLTVGAVSNLSWRRGKDLKATVTGKGASAFTYDLVPGVSQNPVHGQVLSGAVGVCFQCASAGHDGSDGKLFSAKGADCAAPTSCP